MEQVFLYLLLYDEMVIEVSKSNLFVTGNHEQSGV